MEFSKDGIIKQEISQVFSGRLLTLSILLLFFYLVRNFKPNKIFVLFYILILSIALGITSFRAGILGLLLVLIVYYLFTHSQLRDKYILPAIFIFLAGLLISSQLNENLIKRFHWVESFSQQQKIVDATVNSRIKAYEISLLMFYEKPIFGFGAGGFNSIYNNSDLGKWIKYPHNNFLELIAETGLFGTILFFIIFIKSVKSLLKSKIVELKYFMLLLFIFSFFSKDLSTNIILLLPAISNHKNE
jgi:O-antigen ligase